MRVLCVGGAGYLGGAVVNALMAHEVTVYDSLLYRDEYLRAVNFVRGDVRDYPKLAPELAKADAVIWLAAIVGDAACSINPTASIATNEHAVAYLAGNYRRKIIFTSSCSVYGVNDAVATENSPLAPLSIYAETKINAEQCLLEHTPHALILRLGTLHGLGERVRFDLAVNVLAMRAASQHRVEVFGGAQYRPFLAVQDAAAFIVKMLSLEFSTGIYNLASENLTIAEVAERVKAILPEIEIKRVPMQYEDQRNYRVSSEKAIKQLHFHPCRTIDDSILEIAAAVREGRIKDLGAARYSNATALEGSA